MCVGRDCFQVGIGKNGPKMTQSGTGTLGEASGAKYRTLKKATTKYDRDALAMGIPGNDQYGKWIHKTRKCRPTSTTLGCVAVPCSKWPLVKRAKGRKVTICNGAGGSSSSNKKNRRNNGAVR